MEPEIVQHSSLNSFSGTREVPHATGHHTDFLAHSKARSSMGYCLPGELRCMIGWAF